MTDMTDIPDDVMKAADALAVALADSCNINPGWHEIRVLASEHIARAIMAERERCAKVAEAAPYNKGGIVCGCSEGLANWIAAAIRKGKP